MTGVLIVSTVGLLYDGITNVVLSQLRALNMDELDIHVVSTVVEEPQIAKEIESLGCKIVRIPHRKKNTTRYFLSLIGYIRKNNISVIHAHGNSATLAIEMLAGLIGGCKKRIAHSHNTKCEQVMADKLLRPLFYSLYTDALACGEAAGKWLFRNRKFIVLTNGRDTNYFKFNSEIREIMRDKLGLSSNSLAFGHVGAICEQKNHSFLLGIYESLLTKYPASKCFIIGDGPMREQIEKKAKSISDRIVFTGNIPNVNDYLQAMDGMLLPSLFEGLPLVVVEWQMNGLPCVVSDVVTEECAFSSLIWFESLESKPETWAQKIVEKLSDNREKNSKDAIICARNKGFDIYDTAKILKRIYIE